MGKLKGIAMAVLVVALVGGLFMGAMNSASDDLTKTDFVVYAQVENQTESILEHGSDDGGYTIGTNPTTNLEMIANRILESITAAQAGMQGSFLDQLGAAFGLLSALTINVVLLLIAVIFETINLIAGIISNLAGLPPPWNYTAVVGAGFGLVAVLVYMVITLVGIATKTDP